MSNSSRQRKWRETQREKGRSPLTLWATEDEKFILTRMLEQMRKTGMVPASMRDEKGRYQHFDC